MAITAADVKLVKSSVMLDTTEGGGAPSGNVITDGTSNSIFPDISELDRAIGRVNLRKVFASVQTTDTDGYYGANMIVADPPEDPRVSVTLFSTESTFDVRTNAASRIESYLASGAEWAGYLYENHLTGQRVIQIFQRTTAQLPNVGQTLVIVENENTTNQKQQYVRATSVSSEIRTFSYLSGSTYTDYQARIVTLGISDALRYDFTGTPATPNFARNSSGTKVRDTVVADAGTYVGIVPLVEAASVGDFTISGQSIFTQLVPSAQTETPIADVRTNGLESTLVASGGSVSRSLTLAFSTTQNMFVGGPIYPGSLNVTRSGTTVTDSGGVLINGSTQVGTVDYDNGILTLTSNVWGTGSGTHTVVFTPATLPNIISNFYDIKIAIENRSLSYAFTLTPKPAPRSVSLSYRAQGNWYVLRDNGAGVLKGTDTAYGAGTINYTTGSILVTLGALPDVGSVVLVQFYSDVQTITPGSSVLSNSGKVYAALNTSGNASEEQGNKAISPGSLGIQWTDDGLSKQAEDDGLGNITGDATGKVDYTKGVVRLSPNTLPAAGTIFVLNTDKIDLAGPVGPIGLGGLIGATNITPGSVRGSIFFYINYAYTTTKYFDNQTSTFSTYNSKGYFIEFFDDGNGNLKCIVPTTNETVTIGTINYLTGLLNSNTNTNPIALASPEDPLAPTAYKLVQSPTYNLSCDWIPVEWTDPILTNRSRSVNIAPSFINVFYGTTAVSTANAISVTVNEYYAKSVVVPNYALRGARFKLGSSEYVQQTDNVLVYNVSPTTGVGTVAGSVSAATGVATISAWTTGVTSTISEWRGIVAPSTEIAYSPFTALRATFRIAATPVRPGSFSVLGTMQDGTQFNVTAGTDGKINGTRVKGLVDYEYGLVELYFVNPAGDTNLNVDLSNLNISGLSTIPADLVNVTSVRYNAVAYSYLPLDADIIGIDPVRLPTDGKVPIFRTGGVAVVGHTGTLAPTTVSNGQTLNCGRVRLSRVRVIGNNGSVITTGYTADLEAGTVTFNDVSGYSQPVTVEHRIEDMALVSDVQINGDITFTRALTHNYPVPGSYVSSALIAGDLQARVSITFDQGTWNGTWSDALSGGAATGTFNTALTPIAVTNKGAVTERWALQFTNTTSFNIIGEHVGVIGTGSTGTDCSPVNPATSAPYFTVPAAGWGLGWSTGNVLRFNTVGAQFPVWVVRTILQGPETVTNDNFTLLIRGDVDQP